MIVTERRIGFYRFMSCARWAYTSQVHRRFFSGATLDAARKWLRKDIESKHLVAFRANRMSETVFTLGREGKRVLEQAGSREIRLETKLPKLLSHLGGVNDVRIAAELTGVLSFFFSYWELTALNWRHAIIPDALFELAGKTYALEFDRGLEGIQFFLRTKMVTYERGLEGLPLHALIIVSDRPSRVESLARALACSSQVILFSTLEQIRREGLSALSPQSRGVRSLLDPLLSDSLVDRIGSGP